MTSIDNFANEIVKELQRFSKYVSEEVELAAKDVTKMSVKRLKSKSPVGHYAGGGDYAKGWRVKKVGKNYTVYNATNYQLTHLLEHGHVNRDGSRAQAFPHIKDAEQEAIREFERRLESL
ncbi:HK97 gp10 family phage protein [Lysinibacillus sp. NPDC086135]|uniref:HK97 gp10 family phage protein n=1 Tax=Lysinibacillus sp. NPDC086135 TaxID=3364130 RepID=UPI0037FE8DF5